MLLRRFLHFTFWIFVVIPSFVWRILLATQASRNWPLYSATRANRTSPESIPNCPTRWNTTPAILGPRLPLAFRTIDFCFFFIHLGLVIHTDRNDGHCLPYRKNQDPRFAGISRCLMLVVHSNFMSSNVPQIALMRQAAY